MLWRVSPLPRLKEKLQLFLFHFVYPGRGKLVPKNILGIRKKLLLGEGAFHLTCES
jgi:hypothetical protein